MAENIGPISLPTTSVYFEQFDATGNNYSLGQFANSASGFPSAVLVTNIGTEPGALIIGTTDFIQTGSQVPITPGSSIIMRLNPQQFDAGNVPQVYGEALATTTYFTIVGIEAP